MDRSTRAPRGGRAGWSIPAGKSASVEGRPAMWSDLEPMATLTTGQKDAFLTASWLKEADRSGELSDMLQPALSPPERLAGGIEGWILGAHASHANRKTGSGQERSVAMGGFGEPELAASRHVCEGRIEPGFLQG